MRSTVSAWPCAGLMVCVGLASIGGGGCGSAKPIVVVNEISPTQERLLQLAAAYRAAYARGDRPPSNATDLRRSMKEAGIADEALMSPRDGKPFVIDWKTPFAIMPDPRTPPSLLAHEAVGENGTRYVLWSIGTTELLTEDAFAAASRSTQP